MLSLASVVQQSPEVMATRAGAELIMVSIETGNYYGLAELEREVWDAIAQPKRVLDVVDQLTSSYDIDVVSCQAQTLSFFQALWDEGLLQVQNESDD